MERGWFVVALAVATVLGTHEAACGAYDAAEPADGGATDAGLPPSDAAEVDAAPAIDAAPPSDAATVRCDPTKPFADKHPIIELNTTGYEYGITLSPDETVAYFGSSANASVYRIYTARRPTAAAPFGARELVSVSAAADAGSRREPAISADGLTLYFSDLDTNDIRVAKRATVNDPFGPVSKPFGLPSGSANVIVHSPFVATDGRELYFVVFEGQSAKREELMVATGSTPQGSFTMTRSLDELNTPLPDQTPVLSPDGLTLYFASNAEDTSRIHVSKRASTTSPFGKPVHLEELDGPGAYEQPRWISPDGCVLYYQSPAGIGGTDLWVATRPK